ncbi:LysR family transcriptional regulator [Bowmanella yangjiangensis]|uniref:LysR family transcriptional regulator n=1 Tax=Bowmanella yangjiangensis TaxID=2811230 RepID=A0ABS3CT95_9ALTE|nr:LysR family transcriptional regulator [Bowmanella yangjiangensis]MBN7819734.1 LysR family transcriptional regulator [Bowmanella yangjiangensis]
MDFDWDDAKAFLLTAETGSLTAAAKQLRTSQPTIGRRVAALEESLGIVLFERSKNSLFLTPQGERIFQALQGMEQVANDTILVAKGATESLPGVVTIASSQIDAVFRLPALIAELKKLEPTLQIKLEVSNDSADLIHRNADIAIRNFRPTEENLIIRKLGDAQVSLFGTPQLCTSLNLQKKTIPTFPIIGFIGTDYLTQVLIDGGIAKDQINYVCLSDFQLTHIELAKRGLGLAILPTNLGKEIPELECALPEEHSVYDYSTWLVCHSELRHNRRIRFVYEFLAERLARTV